MNLCSSLRKLAYCSLLGLWPQLACAGTFYADLDLTPTEGEFGSYLSASFDFGVRFKSIEGMRLELDMPEGFQGTAVSTGNSSLFRYLHMQVHSAADSPPVDSLADYLGASPMEVTPGLYIPFEIKPMVIGVGGWEVFPMPWPDFLLSGAGKTSFQDVSISSWHPLPNYVGAYSTTSWSIPAGLEGARLVLDGTVVPEPRGIILAIAAAGAGFGMVRWSGALRCARAPLPRRG